MSFISEYHGKEIRENRVADGKEAESEENCFNVEYITVCAHGKGCEHAPSKGVEIPQFISMCQTSSLFTASHSHVSL